MNAEAGTVSAGGQTEKKRSLKMDVEELEEPDSDFEEYGTKRLNEEPDDFLSKKRKHSGDSGAELYGAESSGFLPSYPVCVPRGRWGDNEDIQNKLLHSCCTAEGSIDQTSPSSMLEHWMYTENHPTMTTITPPATPGPGRPCPFIPVPDAVNPMVCSPVTDTCSPISSMCSPTSSAWDTLRSTSRSPGGSEGDPVNAAAHLHLLGESLSLIGQHLQETNKMVSMSSSLSLLLDSLLCALAPLTCLTTQIPELRSCTQHTLASTLENIAYVMPGL